MLTQNNLDKTTYKIYNYDEKKRIVYKIENIKNKKEYFKLYNLVNNSNVQFTKNNNGIFFNINKLSNETLYEIDCFLNELDEKNKLIQDSEMSNNDSDCIMSIDDNTSSSLQISKDENNLKFDHENENNLKFDHENEILLN